MNRFLSLIRLVVNRIRFLIMRVLGKRVDCTGLCTARLGVEYSCSKHGILAIGKHFCALSGTRVLVRGGDS